MPLVERTGPWYRSHRLAHEPLHFGRSGRNRFDAPTGEYGVLYAGADPHVAFVETFARIPGRTDSVTWKALASRALAKLASRRPLRLVDLTGSGLARLRADARIASGDPAVARRWSRAFHGHPDRPDGILYRARHDPGRLAVAIFDRAAEEITAVELGSFAAPVNEKLLGTILDTYGLGLIGGP